MYVRVCVFLYFVSVVTGVINHWVLKDERIIPKIDSPFHLREPDNLIAFLDQIRYNDFIESSYFELLRQREQIVEHLRFSVKYGEDLVEQAKCAMNYYLLEKRTSYLKWSAAYLKRLKLPEYKIEIKGKEPKCVHQSSIQFSDLSKGYEHLDSFKPEAFDALHIEPEDNINIDEIGVPAVEVIRSIAAEGLSRDPSSWKYYTIASYYWRLQGEAQQAFNCARMGVLLAPREDKDIALLSMGTILFRAGRLTEADEILNAAVNLAPDVCENHYVFASALAMNHDFRRSLYHFDEAERLDPSIMPKTLPVRNFINCLDNLNKRTSKMNSYVQYMKNEVLKFKKRKQQISKNHEKLVQQQVPLGVRFNEGNMSNDDLVQRGQYCSKRTVSGTDKPVLFCDFYSDMQMKLESNDVDIESLETELKLTTEAVINQVSTEFRKKYNTDYIKTNAQTVSGRGRDHQ